MQTIWLFSDGSVNPKTKTGFGACLCVDASHAPHNNPKDQVQLKQFSNTSSSQLEIETALWALKQLTTSTAKIILYTDSQNLVGLLDRRTKLEANNFASKKNERIKNADIYQQFYALYDALNLDIIKVKGHKKSSDKDEIDQLFNLVDKASRQALRGSN